MLRTRGRGQDAMVACPTHRYCPPRSKTGKRCPGSQITTDGEGAVSRDDCVCRAGYYMDNSGEGNSGPLANGDDDGEGGGTTDDDEGTQCRACPGFVGEENNCTYAAPRPWWWRRPRHGALLKLSNFSYH